MLLWEFRKIAKEFIAQRFFSPAFFKILEVSLFRIIYLGIAHGLAPYALIPQIEAIKVKNFSLLLVKRDLIWQISQQNRVQRLDMNQGDRISETKQKKIVFRALY